MLKVPALTYYMVIDGGLLPDITLLLTQCYLHRGTNLFECHEEVLYLQPLIPPINVLTFFPP